MKFSCQKNELLNALQSVSKAISPRPAVAILENIDIIAKENCLELTASDGSLYIRSTIPANIEQEGRACVSAKLFSAIIRQAKPGSISIAMDDNYGMEIRFQNTVLNIKAQNDDLFPRMSTLYHNEGIHVAQGKLKAMISHVLFAIAVGEVRQILNGGLLEITPTELRLVGLDGFKMSLQIWEDAFVLPKDKDMVKCIIPQKVLTELMNTLGDDDTCVTLHMNDSNIMFCINNIVMVSSLYAGEYINYRALLPKTFETTVQMPKEDILTAVETAGLVAESMNNNIVKLTIENGKMMVTSRGNQGETNTDLSINHFGQAVEIGFNGKYLCDILKNIDAEHVEIGMNGPLAPCILSPRDSKHSQFLLMSVRI